MLMNLFNLLSDSPEQQQQDTWVSWVIMGGALVIIIVLMIFTRRSQKKKQDENNAMLDAIAPGNKVKTIGGICGVVVEVCKEDNTFILETGSEESGKSYIKFDKQAVFQTDAKPATQSAPIENEDAPSEDVVPESEVFTETAPEAPVEAPAPEATEEKAE